MLQRFYQRRNKNKSNESTIPWEKLLKTPIHEHRKYSIWRILAPYLSNVKHSRYEQSYDIIERCLKKCNEIRELDFDIDSKINDALNRALDGGYLPISFDNPEKEPKTLKTENRELYSLLKLRNS